MTFELKLGDFALCSLTRAGRGDASAAAAEALVHYWGRIDSGDPPPATPHDLMWAELDGRVLRISADERIAAAVAAEATRLRLSLQQLLHHAVLVYLSDLDRCSPAG